MLHQTTYWAAAAGVMSFATAYLLEQGFAASRVGVLLACGNLLSCLLQPLLAERADRSGGGILLRLMGGDPVQTAQLYSKEIENSAQNVDALLDGAYSAPALTDRRLLGWLLLGE